VAELDDHARCREAAEALQQRPHRGICWKSDKEDSMRKPVLFYKDGVDTSTHVARSGSGERGLQICRGDEGTPEPLPNQDTDTTIPTHHFATT
jgi:hypothetical protein